MIQTNAIQTGVNVIRQRTMERQHNIVLTYSNAVPRIGSASIKEKKKMGTTFNGEKQQKQH